MTTDTIDRLETILGRLLLAGVLTSAVLLLSGLVLWIANAVPALANGLLNGGLIVLMMTPILRVVVSLIEYVRMRDWFFVMTTLAVLTVLLASVVLALRSN